MADNRPGKGLFGWFGRQVGYVKKAVKTTPTARPPKASARQSGQPEQPSRPKPAPSEADADGALLYRHGEVHEAEHPTQPGVKLRRTIIDEVIVDPDAPAPGLDDRGDSRQ